LPINIWDLKAICFAVPNPDDTILQPTRKKYQNVQTLPSRKVVTKNGSHFCGRSPDFLASSLRRVGGVWEADLDADARSFDCGFHKRRGNCATNFRLFLI
jgi:hypothetical protein